MKYELIFSNQSKDDLSRLKKDEPYAFKKASRMWVNKFLPTRIPDYVLNTQN